MFEIAALIWLLIKLAVIFMVLPLLFLVILASMQFYLYLYKLICGHKYENPQDLWREPIKRIAQFWYYQSRFVHGYELHGVENIPDGPAILIFYHSSAPIDMIYAMSYIYMKKNRKIVPIVEKRNFEAKGVKSWLEATESTAGTIESCIETLQQGRLLAIAPGGFREAFFSDSSSYNLSWGTRSGFAKVAIGAKVPIIPLFTQNTREITYVPNFLMELSRKIYNKHKFGVLPTFGWFPVKLRTYIGKPIEYDPSRSVDQLVQLTKESLEGLIKQHQTIPGSICSALLDRFISNNTKCN